MGRMVDGAWQADAHASGAQGQFHRPPTRFRDRVTADGSSGFAPEAGRYHLYVSYACPWAHRTLIVRSLRRLHDALPISVVDPLMGDDGWAFSDAPGATREAVHGARFLREVYAAAKPDYTGRVTVPVLLDTRTGAIVNNESRDLMRMLDTAFAALGDPAATLLPAGSEAEVDATLDALYEPLNNGVYRAGFAGHQAAYDEACREVFRALDRWEGVLARQRFLCGAALTEADVALFTTLLRFDLVYYAHFKCNLHRVQDYPNLWGFVRDVYQTPGVGETCNLDHIKRHYYWSQTTVNPRRIVPLGPSIDFAAPHDRAARFASGT